MIRIILGILTVSLGGFACGGGSVPATPPAAATGTASAATLEKPAPSPSAREAAAPAATPPADRAEVVDPELARKTAQIEWALKQDAIKQDPDGQWASQARSSSALNDAQGNAYFAPSQATGPANVERYGNNGSAWSPKMPDAGIEWLELSYAKPVHASAVRIRESLGSGAVIKVELFDEKGTAHAVWSGTDATTDLNYFVVEFPKTAYKTGRLKLTLATNIVSGWNQIDAVQLVGTEQ